MAVLFLHKRYVNDQGTWRSFQAEANKLYFGLDFLVVYLAGACPFFKANGLLVLFSKVVCLKSALLMSVGFGTCIFYPIT